MPTITEVYECICDELSYQVSVKEQICRDSRMEYQESPRSVADWLLLFKGKYDDIVYSMSHEAGTLYTLGHLRELAALCMRCIMEHGAYCRHSSGLFMKMKSPVPLDADSAWLVALCERLYQDKLGPELSDGHKHSVSAFMVLFDSYRRKAFDAWTDTPGDKEAEQIVGMLLGIVVHCMEDHGAPKREWDHVRRP